MTMSPVTVRAMDGPDHPIRTEDLDELYRGFDWLYAG